MRNAIVLLTLLAPGVVSSNGYTSPTADEDRRARQNFQLHCVGCHGENGTGLKGKVPSLPETLPQILASTTGREFLLRVPGVAQSALKSSELAAVLNWVVREYAEPRATSAFSPFSASEIEQARKQPLLEVSKARPRLRDGNVD